jgi:hypothetical protein
MRDRKEPLFRSSGKSPWRTPRFQCHFSPLLPARACTDGPGPEPSCPSAFILCSSLPYREKFSGRLPNGMRGARIAFLREVSDPAETRKVLAEMVQQARSQAE